MKIMLIVGARPQFIKAATIINMLKKDPQTELQLIHTGQHYQHEMSQIFFQTLNLPEPQINLNIGSASHARQTAKMMTKLEKIITKLKPDIVLVPGDTNSTLAGALAAIKLHIPVGHIEAGLRSYDLNMPEEVNRKIVDHCSLLLFAPTETAVKNLLKEGVNKKNVFQVGDTMTDVLENYMPLANKGSSILQKLELKKDSYEILTLHRPENVDNKKRFEAILDALKTIEELRIVFPIHPRTTKMALQLGLYKKIKEMPNIQLIEPVSYLDFIMLMKNSKIVLTDSGGIQKEAFLLGVPCITFRYNTEWPETLKTGANSLVGADKKLIIEAVKKLLENKKLKNKTKSVPNPYGDGTASNKIINIIKAQNSEGKLKITSPQHNKN